MTRIKKSSRCAVCEYDLSKFSDEAILRLFNVCRKHKKELTTEVGMQCSVCGSQDVTLKQGISKSGKNEGKPWKAYDCNEKECKNEKGYPSRTFVPMARPGGKATIGNSAPAVSGTLEKKVDRILAILEKNFGKTVIAKEEDETEVPF